ncbi:MAG: DUF5700 domain-containing putative Zn-dependent protease [Chloroflexota bacterium]
MLTIECLGAQSLFDVLKNSRLGQYPSQAEISSVLDANAFFVDYYCQWKGVTRQNIGETVQRFAEPSWQSEHPVLAGLARGFHFALENLEELQAGLDNLKGLDASALAEQTATFLPPDTPLDATIHYTVDGFNGGFQFQDGIGLSLLHFNHPDQLGPVIRHELHHVGFGYWAVHDPIRQAILTEISGRAVAVRHAQNLLAEGLANFYCSPLKADLAHMPAAVIAKLEHFAREDRLLLAQASDILTKALTPGADFQACQRAYDEIAVDLEGIQPAGHYIGARMVEIMSQVHSTESIVACVCSLPNFLVRYNQAAEQTGAPLFDPTAVVQFGQLWQPNPESQ